MNYDEISQTTGYKVWLQNLKAGDRVLYHASGRTYPGMHSPVIRRITGINPTTGYIHMGINKVHLSNGANPRTFISPAPAELLLNNPEEIVFYVETVGDRSDYLKRDFLCVKNTKDLMHLPRIGEGCQSNGIFYRVEDVIHNLDDCSLKSIVLTKVSQFNEIPE